MTSITDALSGVVTFGYDDAGQQTSLTDQRNETWTYAYNALGMKTSETDPLDRETTWTYDAEAPSRRRPTRATSPRATATTTSDGSPPSPSRADPTATFTTTPAAGPR